MQKQSLSKNFIFQFLYQGLILLIPLVLSPYLTRVLQETALGTYTYINSTAYYFVIFAMLGISRHGQRIVSQNVNDELKLRKAFWSLFTLHAAISLLSVVLYFVFILIFVNTDKTIYIIEAIYVASAIFDITWLFYGLENFKSVVIKNAFIKVVEGILIFSLVKYPGDLWIYTLITAAGTFLGQVVMLPQAVKTIRPIKFSKSDISQHIRPLLIFAISVVASTLYTVFDKTLLGLLSTKENVGFYEYSNKIINIPKTIIGVIGTVMFPRACRMAAEGNILGQRKYIKYSFLITSFIGMGSIWGLFAISNLFARLYYGETFSVCGPIIKTMAPLIYVIGIGDIIRTQYMIPNGMDKQFNFCIVLNAVINLILSTALIPVCGIYGAVIGTISAELFGIIYQLILCRKFIRYGDILKSLTPFLIIGFIMFASIKLISPHLPQDIIGLIVEVLFGVVVYCGLSLVYIICFEKDIKTLLGRKFGIRNKQ